MRSVSPEIVNNEEFFGGKTKSYNKLYKNIYEGDPKVRGIISAVTTHTQEEWGDPPHLLLDGASEMTIILCLELSDVKAFHASSGYHTTY